MHLLCHTKLPWEKAASEWEKLNVCQNRDLKLPYNGNVTSKVFTNSYVMVYLPTTNQNRRTENSKDFVTISQKVHEMRYLTISKNYLKIRTWLSFSLLTEFKETQAIYIGFTGTADKHKLHHVLMNHSYIYVRAHTHHGKVFLPSLPPFFFPPKTG